MKPQAVRWEVTRDRGRAAPGSEYREERREASMAGGWAGSSESTAASTSAMVTSLREQRQEVSGGAVGVASCSPLGLQGSLQLSHEGSCLLSLLVQQ